MELECYKTFSQQILIELPNPSAYYKYIRLLEVFVQDCSLPVSQKYFGNLTKEKSKIIFELQEKFLNFKDVTL